MRIFDIITKKKRGLALDADEIKFVVEGYTAGKIDDGPMAALLMAICFVGLNREETAHLTIAMAHSGKIADLSAITRPVVDKHSTGGVGDKLTLIVGPIAAACGIAVAKMSGRSLGHTGGTIDKLEGIPGFCTDLSPDKFIKNINKIGIAITGQNASLAPADKKIYALRDKTAAVDSIPLIAASIMSKKIAAGAGSILLDVKAGSGAFMKTVEEAEILAETMVQIGRDCGKNMAAVVSAMDAPLGRYVGNLLELAEAAMILKGNGDADLMRLSVELAAMMLYLGKLGDMEDCRQMAQNSITGGTAYNKFIEMIEAQGGDIKFDAENDLYETHFKHSIKSPMTGYVNAINGENCGIAGAILEGGLILRKKPGEYVKKDEILVDIFAKSALSLSKAEALILEAYTFAEIPPEKQPLIHRRFGI